MHVKVRSSVGDMEDMENDDAFVLSSSIQSPDVERLVSEVRFAPTLSIPVRFVPAEGFQVGIEGALCRSRHVACYKSTRHF